MQTQSNTTQSTYTPNPAEVAMVTGMLACMEAPKVAYMLITSGKEALAMATCPMVAVQEARNTRTKERAALLATGRRTKVVDPAMVVYQTCAQAGYRASQDAYNALRTNAAQEGVACPAPLDPTLPMQWPARYVDYLANMRHPEGTFDRRKAKPANSKGWVQAADGYWLRDRSGTYKGSASCKVADYQNKPVDLVVRINARQQSRKDGNRGNNSADARAAKRMALLESQALAERHATRHPDQDLADLGATHIDRLEAASAALAEE